MERLQHPQNPIQDLRQKLIIKKGGNYYEMIMHIKQRWVVNNSYTAIYMTTGI